MNKLFYELNSTELLQLLDVEFIRYEGSVVIFKTTQGRVYSKIFRNESEATDEFNKLKEMTFCGKKDE